MKKGLFGLFAVVFLLFAGTAMAGPVEVSGGLDIIDTGVTFPDSTTQTTAVNGSLYQKRVTGTCSSGYAISSIDSTGAVVGCQSMGAGSVTSVGTGTGLTGGPVTTTGTISIAAGGVTDSMVAAGGISGSKINGNISGNAVSITGSITESQVTNLTSDLSTKVNITGTYADPSWITSLSGSKISGNIQGSAASITGSITESQVTNLTSDLSTKVSITGTYADPSWITSLSGSKISGGIQGNAASITGNITESQVTSLTTDLSNKASKGGNTDITSLTGLDEQNAITINSYGAAAGNTGEIRFQELGSNGTSYIGLKAPDSIALSKILTLPPSDGASGQALTTDGSGNLGWATLTGGTVTSVGTSSGLTGGPITGTGTISIATGGVTNSMLATGISGSKITGDIPGNAASITGNITESQVTNLATDLSNKALKGANSDITSLSGLTTPLSISQGGTGITTAPSAAGQYLRSTGAGAWDLGSISLADLPSLSGAYVDLTTNQTIGGAKTFSNDVTLSGSLVLPAVITATPIIWSGTDSLIRTNDSTNFFAGINAGNLTMHNINNTAIGAISLRSNTWGGGNTAIGAYALRDNTTGEANTASGMIALSSNTAGSYNTASGVGALGSNRTASRNTAVGYAALETQSYDNGGMAWDSNNTAVGYQALFSNQPTSTVNGILNTAVGAKALYSNTTGSGNTATGELALNSNSTGSSNTATGISSLNSNTTANKNTAVGDSALYTQSYANGGAAWDSNNTAVGYQALFFNQPTATAWSGNNNTAVGSSALRANTTGYYNVASGMNALLANTTGYANAANGYRALHANTSGIFNTAIGYEAGYSQTTGNNNTYVGANVFGVAGESNVIRIGDSSAATYISGINGVTSSGGVAVYVNGSGQLGTLTSSKRFKEDIKDMGDATDDLMKLRPVTFYYKPEDANGPRLLQYGLIAEEVAEIYPGLVQYDDKGQPNTVYYQFVNAMLLNEVQKQHKKIDDQKEQIKTLEERLCRLEALISK